MTNSLPPKRDLVGQLVAYFIDSQITILLVLALTLFSIGAVILTPKEENPQINVPSAVVSFTYPGASAEVVERSITTVMESRIRELENIDHIFSTSMNSGSQLNVQFKTGTDWEKSIFNLRNQLATYQDFLPAGVTYVVQSNRSDDVPIVTLTVTGKEYTDNQLRRVGERLLEDLRQVPNTSNLTMSGGQPRLLAVDLNPDKLASYHLSPAIIAEQIQKANTRLSSGDVSDGQNRLYIQGGDLLQSASDVENIVVSFGTQKDSNSPAVGTQLTSANYTSPVYLKDVATIRDDFGDRTTYSRASFRQDLNLDSSHPDPKARPHQAFITQPAITIGIAKIKGASAVTVAEEVFHRLEELKSQLPPGIQVMTTRNDGYVADAAVEQLFHELVIATASVVLMMMIFLGWRDSLIVAVVIPLTLGTTIGIGWLAGHTINKVALFALIISLGILVDDGVVIVENIHRRFDLKPRMTFPEKLEEAIAAVSEIGAPTVVATLTVVFAFVPLGIFITGQVGPYLAPLAFNVPFAMILSLFLAMTVTPYMAVRMIKQKPDHSGKQDLHQTRIYRTYRVIMQPLLDSRRYRRLVIGAAISLLLITLTLPFTQAVKLRVLPKGNDDTFLIQLDAPLGTDLDRTDKIVQEIETALRQNPEITSFETYVGTAAPIDFSSLVKGSATRTDKHYADIRVHLTQAEARKITVENLVIQLRPALMNITTHHNSILKIIEKQTGPAQRATVLAEIYGPNYHQLQQLAKSVRQVFANTDRVTDIDDSVKNQQPEMNLAIEQDKALRSGVEIADLAQTLQTALSGTDVSTLKVPGEIVPMTVQLRFAQAYRRSVDDLTRIQVPTQDGRLVPLSELVSIGSTTVDRTIYHKDQRPVTYVYGEMTNRSSIYAIFDQLFYFLLHPLSKGYWIRWDGEWKLTVDLFRDISVSIAFSLTLIYLLLVGQFHSFKIPLIILGSIPLSFIGILTSFALNGAYFSALSLVGVIALAGMVVRNAIVLIEFIGERLHEGEDLKLSILEAGAVRFRPILLTSMAAILGNAPILLDPVWQGLGWTIITGMIASSTLTLVIVPLVYYGDHLKHKCG